MIQRYLKEEMEALLPDLEWTVDFYTGQDHTGTVFYEGGRKPSVYEDEVRYPRYMIYIRSSAWSYAESAAKVVYEALHRKKDFIVTVNEYDKNENVIGSTSYRVFFVSAASEPNRIGVQDDLMDWSVNFDVALRKIEEE